MFHGSGAHGHSGELGGEHVQEGSEAARLAVEYGLAEGSQYTGRFATHQGAGVQRVADRVGHSPVRENVGAVFYRGGSTVPAPSTLMYLPARPRPAGLSCDL